MSWVLYCFFICDDNNLVIWPRGKKKSLMVLSPISAIEFSMKTESLSKVPFLDEIVNRLSDGSRGYFVYRNKNGSFVIWPRSEET